MSSHGRKFLVDIKAAKGLPPIARGGGKKVTEEHLAIQKALETGKPQRIDGVETRDQHNALQQKIRSVAKSHNIPVTVRYSSDEQATYFQDKRVLETTE